MEKDTFTAREVGALLERLESKFDLLAEGFAPIPEKLEKIEERLSVVEVEVRLLKDAVYVAIPDHAKRIHRIESKLGLKIK